MKFKVGDKVKFIKKIHNHSSRVKLGELYTIGYIDNIGDGIPYQIKENGEWFKEDELEFVKTVHFTKSDLKDKDVITFRNNRQGIVLNQGKTIRSMKGLTYSLEYYNENLVRQTEKSCNSLDIIKVKRPVKYETVYERKEEILDAVEKRYLGDVIRPFRSKIKSIRKKGHGCCLEECIVIDFKNGNSWYFPEFQRDTKYKEMEVNKSYTLEELRTIKE